MAVEGDDLDETASTVRRRRARTGLSQDDLADAADVGRSTVQKIERGEPVRLKNLLRVMDALDEAERRILGQRRRDPISIDEFLAQDPNLDDDTRQHFRNQYDLLVGLTRYRRRTPADQQQIDDVNARRPGSIPRIVRNAATGMPPAPPDSAEPVTPESEQSASTTCGDSTAS